MERPSARFKGPLPLTTSRSPAFLWSISRVCGIHMHGYTHTQRAWCGVEPQGSENGKRRRVVRGKGIGQQKSSAAMAAAMRIALQSPMAEPSSGMAMHLTFHPTEKKTYMTMKGERTPGCQCQKGSLPRCLLQTASRNSTAQCPDRQSVPHRKHTGIHACRRRRPRGGSLEGVRPDRAGQPSGKQHAPIRQDGGKGSWDMAPRQA